MTPELVDAAKQAFVDGWQTSMWAGMVLMVAVAVFVVTRGPKKTAVSVGGDR
jgi:hypothetical protein